MLVLVNILLPCLTCHKLIPLFVILSWKCLLWSHIIYHGKYCFFTHGITFEQSCILAGQDWSTKIKQAWKNQNGEGG